MQLLLVFVKDLGNLHTISHTEHQLLASKPFSAHKQQIPAPKTTVLGEFKKDFSKYNKPSKEEKINQFCRSNLVSSDQQKNPNEIIFHWDEIGNCTAVDSAKVSGTCDQPTLCDSENYRKRRYRTDHRPNHKPRKLSTVPVLANHCQNPSKKFQCHD